MLVIFDMVIDMHAGLFDIDVFIGVSRQWLERGLIDAFKLRQPTAR